MQETQRYVEAIKTWTVDGKSTLNSNKSSIGAVFCHQYRKYHDADDLMHNPESDSKSSRLNIFNYLFLSTGAGFDGPYNCVKKPFP